MKSTRCWPTHWIRNNSEGSVGNFAVTNATRDDEPPRDSRHAGAGSEVFRFPTGYCLPRFEDVGEGIRVGSEECVEQLAAYFDTPDARLTRSGASLRYRSDDGWTVKLPAPSEGSNLVRIERNFAGNDGTPPAGALDLLPPGFEASRSIRSRRSGPTAIVSF